MATITFANFETACAAVPAPYGPLQAVATAVADTTDNSFIALEVQSALGVTFHISYEDLTDSERATRLIAEAHGVDSVVREIGTVITELAATYDDDKDALLTEEHYVSMIGALRAALSQLEGLQQ